MSTVLSQLTLARHKLRQASRMVLVSHAGLDRAARAEAGWQAFRAINDALGAIHAAKTALRAEIAQIEQPPGVQT